MPFFSTVLKTFLFISAAILIIVILAFVGESVFDKVYNFPKIIYGVTFSPSYAKFLKLDWEKTYLSVLNDLKVKNLRLPTEWDNVEKKQGMLDFSESDFMLDEASKSGVEVILTVGNKQPRWPECHTPPWARTLSLKDRQEQILQFIKTTVERYRSRPEITSWQVENEPLLPFFGQDCDYPDSTFLKKEVELVRSLSNKTIIISDSGELGNWILPMQLSDVFGTTLYRDVYNPILGYTRYPILPYFYNLKSQIVRRLFARSNQKTIIIELQAEPWLGTPELKGKPQAQVQFFPLSKLQSYINYAQKVGIDTQYLWGLEWWYFMKDHGYPDYLEYAKTLF